MNIFWKTVSFLWVLIWTSVLILSHETVCSFNNLLSDGFCLNFKGLKPDELSNYGDFLAGIFAPVTFLYLFLNYIDQGIVSKRDYKLNKYSTISPFYLQELREFSRKIKTGGEFSENLQRISEILNKKGEFPKNFYFYNKKFNEITDNHLDLDSRKKIYAELISDWVWFKSCDLKHHREDIISLLEEFRSYILNYEVVKRLFSDVEGIENLRDLLLGSEFTLIYENLRKILENERDVINVLNAEGLLFSLKDTLL
jgi:hypothetical protein